MHTYICMCVHINMRVCMSISFDMLNNIFYLKIFNIIRGTNYSILIFLKNIKRKTVFFKHKYTRGLPFKFYKMSTFS